jgi:NAD(P)-dependent dehydrogenase (short-subunit alcohol dehydrogenase family)
MNILITGCGRGIGYQTALRLSAEEGVSVLALSRSKSNLDKLREEALKNNKNARIFPVQFDLENGNLRDLAVLLKEKAGKVDVLINNAGAIVVKPFDQLEEADFQKVYHLNVFRTAMLIQALLPLMRRATLPKAHIVNISSMGGFQGSVKFPGLAAYSSSKAAICGLTESLGEELKEHHIAVNCLCLGAVQTEMLGEAFPGYQAPVSPAEMGAFIADFAVKGGNYFNGKIIPVSLSTP